MGGSNEPCIAWESKSSKGRGNILGLSSPSVKHYVSLLWCMQQKNIYFSAVKNTLPAHQNSFTTCCYFNVQRIYGTPGEG